MALPRDQPRWPGSPLGGPSSNAEGAFHIRTVNQLQAALEDFFQPFRGPATRYFAWFIARQGKSDPRTAMIAA